MTKAEIKELIQSRTETKQISDIFFNYSTVCFHLIPLAVSEKLFLSAQEDDFILDGFTIRRFRDVTNVKLKEKANKYDEIVKQEGLLNQLAVPPVEMTYWKTVFESLQKLNRNIIAENESINEEKQAFTIGQIERVYKKFVCIRYFDADGVWKEYPDKIFYTDITSVTFGCRYADVFSKYLAEIPNNFGLKNKE